MAKKKEKEPELPRVKTSVRGLVEFISRSGDIDSRGRSVTADAMQEGTRIHRYIQSRGGAGYKSEVSLKYEYDCGGFIILLEGRADGIFTKKIDDEKLVCIDEIKGVYRDVARMKAPEEVHLSQARCYGAIYSILMEYERIGVQLTYCNIVTREIKRFFYEYDRAELEEWFFDLLDEYRKWAAFSFEWKEKRQASIKALGFPFEFRPGQRELCAQVYHTISEKKRLFIEAPTGVGKTISTLFPAIKAMGEGKGEMIFYLTAKSTTTVVAEDTFEIMRSRGLSFKAVTLMAKEKHCILDRPECNPQACIRAKGHFDRVNEALFAMITERDIFSREVIADYSERYSVCPYELSLDLSLFADAVIGDYNYVFDPDASLKRFFADGIKRDYIFLVDEAHNLVDRAREMYSACIYKEDILAAKKLAGPSVKGLYNALAKCNRVMLELRKYSEELCILEEADDLIGALARVAGELESILDDDRYAGLAEDLLEFYFGVRHFLNMSELLDDNYVIYSMEDEEERFLVRLYCVDPHKNLRSRIDRGAAACFFSATMLPVTYYMDLLSGDRNDYAVYARSSFDPANRGVFMATDVTSRYSGRGPHTYARIADYVYEIAALKKGNYMVFFPSYRFLEDVYDALVSAHASLPFEVIIQRRMMSEEDREEFLESFAKRSDGASEVSLVGFCVLGGIFSEGIDLKGDSLIGALVVGTGVPQIGPRLDILREYFDSVREDGKGYDYAYRIPGMNKVMQAAGRVIRTEEDRGIIVLLDERFTHADHLAMCPREWREFFMGDKDKIIKKVKEFWDHDGCK